MSIKYFKIFNFIAFLLLSFYCFLIVHGVVDYFKTAEEFHFGDAMVGKGGWKYLSKHHYLGWLYGELLLSLIGLSAGLFLKNSKWLFLLRASIIAIFLVQIIVFQLSLD